MYSKIENNRFNQNRLEYSLLEISCLCKIAEERPISIKRFVKPNTNITNAIRPKSDLSRYLVKIDNFRIPEIAKMIVENVVHFTPANTCPFRLTE